MKAFTLIEILLYIAIVSVMMFPIVALFNLIQQEQVRNQTVAEVNQNAVQIIEMITTSIRSATGVNAPLTGVTAASLSIPVLNLPNSPTIYDLSGGAIRIKEGAAAVISLSSNRVTASALSFQNLTGVSTKSTIKFQFTLTYINTDNKQQFNYSQTYYGSATIR